MPQGLRLTLLGGLHIELGGAGVEGLLTNKAAALLAYLAVTGRPQTRSTLAGLFWSEFPEARARASLRTALSTLNRVVGSYLQAGHRAVQIASDRPCWSDVAAFSQTVSQVLGEPAAGRGTLSQAQAQDLQTALDLYRGDLLAGCAIYDAPLFEEWLLGERERLRPPQKRGGGPGPPPQLGVMMPRLWPYRNTSGRKMLQGTVVAIGPCGVRTPLRSMSSSRYS